MSRYEKPIDLSMFPNVDIKGCKMVALEAEDMAAAAARCTPQDGSDMDAYLFGVVFLQHQIAQSIVEVEGARVMGPCMASLKWSERTRTFLAIAYKSLNGITDGEREAFAAALSGGGASAGSTTPAASVTG